MGGLGGEAIQVSVWREFTGLGLIIVLEAGGKSLIFPEIDQTRKTPPADTEGDGPGRARSAESALCRVALGGLALLAMTRKSPDQEGICAMRSNHLRVYYGPQEDSATISLAESQVQRDTVAVPLMEVLPLLADAVQSQRTWLHDFADDEVRISMDLYEVLLAYQHYRRPSA
jgi:hypothetical protein